MNAFRQPGARLWADCRGVIFDLVGPQWPYVVGALIFFGALLFANVQFRRNARAAAAYEMQSRRVAG